MRNERIFIFRIDTLEFSRFYANASRIDCFGLVVYVAKKTVLFTLGTGAGSSPRTAYSHLRRFVHNPGYTAIQ